MNILVAVASKHGSTREIAEAIAAELRAANINVDLREVDDVASVAAYDAVVLGSAIYAGNWLPEAKRFAETQRESLAKLAVWLFSSGPLGDAPQPQVDPAKLVTGLGDLPVRDHVIFVGKLDRSSLSLGERLIAKVVKAPDGDFRDWDDIRGWARGIVEALAYPQTLA